MPLSINHVGGTFLHAKISVLFSVQPVWIISRNRFLLLWKVLSTGSWWIHLVVTLLLELT